MARRIIEPVLRGTLTAEQVREAVESNSWAETCSIREFSDSSWQAIADELNSQAERACETNTFLADAGEGWERWITECVECGAVLYEANTSKVRILPNYCPCCGAKVVGSNETKEV